MTLVASLPIIDVYIAFNPTASATTINTAYAQALPSTGTSNTYWTNVSNYVKDFQKSSGRQHFLDRIETGTLQMTLNAGATGENTTTGFFWNGTVNGQSAVLGSRLPIAVTLTWPQTSGTTFNAFFGLIDSAKEVITDQVNVDIDVQASDFLKQLSLRNMESPALWASYVNSQSATSHYSCTTNQTAVITKATGNGTTITYTAFNNLSASDTITITGLTVFSGASLNLVNVVVASASASQFTVTNATVGVSQGTGSAYRSRVLDTIGTQNGLYLGTVAFPTTGAVIYLNEGCVDLANGSNVATGYIQLPPIAATHGAIDFWVLGQGIASTVLTVSLTTEISSVWTNIELIVTATGILAADINSGGTIVNSSVQVNDGYWHHVGLVCDSGGTLKLYVDGTFTSLAAAGTCSGLRTIASTDLAIGNTTVILGAPAMQVDEIVVSDQSSLSTLEHEVQNRYVAGTLLQLPTNPAGTAVPSGDRIAEILVIAGFGHISAGAIVLNANFYFINNGGAWVKGTSGNGFIPVQPWYWDSPVYDSTALDLIYEICDTDIGSFFQKDDGTMAFYNQNFYGSWVWNATTNTGVWTPNPYAPATDHVWTDDDSGYAYDGPTLDIERDDADLWTNVRVTPQSGIDQIYENTAAEALYGYTTLVKSGTLHTTLNLAQSTANYLGYLFRSPLPRVQAVTFLSQTNDGGNNTVLMNCLLGDVVTFKRTPPNAAGAGIIDTIMAIESYDLSFNATDGTLAATYALSPYEVRS